MKFYTLTYDANLPTKQQVNVPTNTDYKIGVKVVKNGELLDLDPADVTLGSLSADADKTNGYVTFTEAAGDDASYTQKKLAIVHVPNEAKLVFTPSKSSVVYQASYNLSATGFSSFFPEDAVIGTATSKTAQPLSTDVTTWDNPVFWPPVTGVGDVVGAKVKIIWPYAGTTGAIYWRMATKTYNALYDDPENPALSAIEIGDLPPKGTPLALKQEPGEDTLTPVRKIELYDNAVLIVGVRKERSTYGIAVLKIEDSKPVDLKFDLLENIFKSQQGELDILGDTSNFYTKGEVDEKLSAKADTADTFTREQLSAFFAPLKDANTGTAKKASEILSGDVVASLYNVAVELYGEPVTLTLVKYTAESELPDWTDDIVGQLTDGTIPNKGVAKSVEIGSHVTSIGGYAFQGLVTLESVTIPGSVKSIGYCTFFDCSGLTNVTIGDGVTTIEDAAFASCGSLSSIEFEGNAPTTVGPNSFDGVASGCKALVSSTATGFPAAGETWNGLVVEYK